MPNTLSTNLSYHPITPRSHRSWMLPIQIKSQTFTDWFIFHSCFAGCVRNFWFHFLLCKTPEEFSENDMKPWSCHPLPTVTPTIFKQSCVAALTSKVTCDDHGWPCNTGPYSLSRPFMARSDQPSFQPGHPLYMITTVYNNDVVFGYGTVTGVISLCTMIHLGRQPLTKLDSASCWPRLTWVICPYWKLWG